MFFTPRLIKSRRGIVMSTVSVCPSTLTLFALQVATRNSSRILTKLDVMNGYGSGMMPIVGRYSSVITVVLVDWFLPKLWCFRILFAIQIAIQIGSLPNLTWWMVMGWGWCLLLFVGRYGPVITAILDDWFLPKIWCFRILFALQVTIQVGSLPNLTWWMVVGRWRCLWLHVMVRWSQPFWLTGFYLKYGVFVYFSQYRSQFKSDPYQTWYDKWLWVGDDAYCWTLRSGDHIRSGWLVSTSKIWCFRILCAIKIAIQVGSLPNLVWWMTMGWGWCWTLRSGDHSRSGWLVST